MLAALVYHKSSHGAVYTMPLLMQANALFSFFCSWMIAYVLFNYLLTPADTGKPMLRIIVFVFVFVFAFVCVFVIIVVIVEVIFFPMMHSMWGVT